MSEQSTHEELGRMLGQLAHRRLSRRHMLGMSAKAGVGAAGLALVGCGGDDSAPATAAPADTAAADAAAAAAASASAEVAALREQLADLESAPADTGDAAAAAAAAAEVAALEDRLAELEATPTPSAPAPARQLRDVKFAFPFGAPFAGFLPEPFSAMTMGYFEEEGFINEVIYQTALLPLIAGGAVDYARLTPVNAMNAFVAGQFLTVVFQNTYPFIFTIAAPADSNITSFNADDLRGQSIGITEFEGGEVPMVRSLLSSIGLVEGEDVTLIPTSGTTPQPTIDALNTGRIVAFGGSIFDVIFIEQGGLPMRDISPPEVQALSADDAIGARREFVRSNRSDVIGYCRALAKGTIFTLESPRAAAIIGLEYAPDSGHVDDIEEFVNLFVATRAIPPAGTSLGEVPVDGWNDYQAFLLRGGTGSDVDPLAFTEPFDTSAIIDNSLQSEIWDFDAEQIRQDARDFLAANDV